MNEVILGRMIHLGHGQYVKSDAIIAVEPIVGRLSRTNYSRSRVLIAHGENELIASRTAQTIVRDMTKQEEVESPNISNGRESTLVHTQTLKNMIINSMVENDTINSAIASLPFGRTKFYRLVKRYNLDPKDYRYVTNDADMAKDNIGLE